VPWCVGDRKDFKVLIFKVMSVQCKPRSRSQFREPKGRLPYANRELHFFFFYGSLVLLLILFLVYGILKMCAVYFSVSNILDSGDGTDLRNDGSVVHFNTLSSIIVFIRLRI
jgi:hypothetical protein